jgi:hypothetical protein
MQQTWYVNGYLYGSLDTVVSVPDCGSKPRGSCVATTGALPRERLAGVAWFIVKPSAPSRPRDTLTASLFNQGYLAVSGNNLTYPALAVLPSGNGAMAFTLVGEDYYPSAAYTLFDATKGPGNVRVSEEGTAPSDGFTSYKAFVGDPPRTRWGDYGAAVTDGKNIWIASEYIQQGPCPLAIYTTSNFNCGMTRTSLANWATRISKLRP